MSYDEVKKYLQSTIAEKHWNPIVPPGHFAQWIADNVDHNINTIDGHNTFHGMGIIMCTSGKTSSNSNILTKKRVKRLGNRISSSDISSEARIKIHFYQSHSSSNLKKLIFEELEYLPIESNLIDLLWQTSKLLNKPCPGWSGYMQTAITGNHPGQTTTFLPMIDLNPTSYSCIYSTLKFVWSEAEKLNIPLPVITFDQCLWIRTMEVICSRPEELP